MQRLRHPARLTLLCAVLSVAALAAVHCFIRPLSCDLEARILLACTAALLALAFLFLRMLGGQRSWKETLFVLLIGVFFLLAAEAAIRILARHSLACARLNTFHGQWARVYGRAQTLDQLLHAAPFRAAPYSLYQGFVMNSKGLRTSEYTSEKAAGTYRAVCLGDSFVMSSGVPFPAHFTSLLQQRLSEAMPNKRVEVINLGVNCVGVPFELKMLEIEACRLSPDIILWCLFVGNDFTDEMGFKPLRLQERPYTWSALLRVIRSSVILTGQQPPSPVRAPAARKPGTYVGWEHYNAHAPSMSRDMFLRNQIVRAVRLHFVPYFPWQNWRRIAPMLCKGHRLCQDFHIPLLMVIIPDENQVNSRLRERVMAKLRGRSGWLSTQAGPMLLALPQRVLATFFYRQGIPVLDLLPAFRRAGTSKSLYKIRDSHWNEAGNRLAADSIYECMCSQNWLPD